MIRLESICYAIGDFQIWDASLEVARGDYFVLMGPPGAGKSLLLECLCGLRRLQSGRIYMGDRDLTDLEPSQRGIGYVPQDYALFPHLSVERNIGFGLRGCGLDRRQIRRKVLDIAEMLGIGDLMQRRIAGLSGGERQRVALARALAPEPKVLLLDEPVSALDESTRDAICAELRRIHRQLGITIIHVSHNLEEAFSVAERAGIMHRGVFQQIGPLSELLRRPQNEFVARFMRTENLLVGIVVGHTAAEATRVKVGEAEWIVPGLHKGEIKFVARPENISLTNDAPSDDSAASRLRVTVERAVDRGPYVRMELTGMVDLVANLPQSVFADLGASEGDQLTAVVPVRAVHVLGAAGDPSDLDPLRP